MGWGLDEYEAGVRRLEDDVRTARRALVAARSGPEVERAREELEKADEALAAGMVMLRTASGQQFDGHASGDHHHSPESSPSLPKSSVASLLRRWGESRREGEFAEARHVAGLFLYAAGDTRTGIALEGAEDRWRLSVFAAARLGVRPTLELYRLVSRWRTTQAAGYPYVVEDGEYAAVMCETSFSSRQLGDDTSARRLITSTIHDVGEAAANIAADLTPHGGVPFTGVGGAGAVHLSSWWKKTDKRIAAAISPG